MLHTEIKEYFEYLDVPKTKELARRCVGNRGGERSRQDSATGDTDVLRYRRSDRESGVGRYENDNPVPEHQDIGDQTTVSDRYYISNRDVGTDWFSRIIYGHRFIENVPHWFLDVCFDEDASRAPCENS